MAARAYAFSNTLRNVPALATERCVPCTRGTPPLPEPEAAALAGEVPAWTRDGARELRRVVVLGDFGEAFGLVARVALLAEAQGHHPDIELGWGRAAFRISTHVAGGLTRNDFVLAAKIDRLLAAP